jgi:hypothetical protein
MWCVENYVPLKQFTENEILVIFYENICKYPQEELEKVMQFIGEPYFPEMLEKATKPSEQTRKFSAINNNADLVSSWRKNISNDQIKRTVEILSIFGLEKIYNEGDMPLVQESDVLKMFSA